MKKLFLILFLFIYSYVSAYEIIVYGSNTCGYTSALRNDLGKNNITFTYCEVGSTVCLNEMLKIANDYNLVVGGYIYYPIVKVVVDNVIYAFSRPSIDKIKQLIGLTNIISNNYDIKIYPNPAINFINVVGNFNKIEVYNVIGALIISKNILDPVSKIDISKLPVGIYFAKLYNESIRIVKFNKI